ncbi:polysaccharide biosynthesis protein [Bacteroides sp. UBA939]|uniref:polysaccharide biosynthesis protein n=1 Tax=Bacteroides sp. UBA939 TaxID=1946092 RepID=UPI0025B9F42A|nr:polysaccharide biosynthesis protein [Bacteroides sp. UBA939]
MSLKVYYKNISSRIASKWIILVIDVCLVLVSMVLSCALQLEKSSIIYNYSLCLWMLFFSLLCNLFSFYIFHTHVGVIRFSSFVDIYRVFLSLTLSYGLLGIGNYCWFTFGMGETLPCGVVFVAYIFNLIFMVCLRILVKMLHEVLSFDNKRCVNVFIYGCHGVGVNIAKSLRISRDNHYRVRGFISDQLWMIGKHTMGCRVYANDSALFGHLKRKDVHTVIVSSDKLADLELSGTMGKMLAHDIHVMVISPLSNCLNDGIVKKNQIEDWLRSEQVHVDIRKIAACIEGRRILITGAAGAVGREIIRQLAVYNPYQLVLVDQAESPLYDIQLELSDDWKNLEVRVLVADVTNRSRMEAIFREYMPQLVFHAAAYKNISMLEDYPAEAMQGNVLGTKNIVDLSVKYRIGRCVIISTDHALFPIHVMGYTKRLAEMYVQGISQKIAEENDTTKLLIVRFGDVYPDIPHGQMTMPEACRLILEIGNFGENGAVYVFEDNAAADVIPIYHEKIKKSKEDLVDYNTICEQINVLVENNYAWSSAEMVNSMKEIISSSVSACVEV